MRLQLGGWGTLTALGTTQAGFERLCAGGTGLKETPAGLGWLEDADGAALLGPLAPVADPVPLPRGVGLALAALAGVEFDGRGLAVVVATTAGAMVEGELVVQEYVRGEPLSAPRAFFWDARLHGVAEAIAAQVGATGPVLAVSTACTSGTVAIGVGADLVRAGRATRALVVGVDALCRTTLFGFRSLGVYDGERCRPFSARRHGMNIGEGAGWVLVEPWQRGVIELLGVGVATDAHHLTAPDPGGRGLRGAIQAALGAVVAARVDHVNAHATGTLHNDVAEAALLAALCPGALVSATKAATGHTLGAAGVIEAVFLAQSMSAGVVPPVAGLVEPLDGTKVADEVRPHPQRVGLSLNLAFGGHNAALALRAWADEGSPSDQDSPRATPLEVSVRGVRSWSCHGGDARLFANDSVETNFRLAPDPQRPQGWSASGWRRLSRLARLVAVVAEPLVERGSDIALFVGLNGEEFGSSVAFLRSYWLGGAALASPLAFQNSVHNAPAAHLSIELGLRGHSETLMGGVATVWRTMERAMCRVLLTGKPALVVIAEDLCPEVRDGISALGVGGTWGEGAAAFLLAPSTGEATAGVRIRWHDGGAPAEAWHRRQPWPDERDHTPARRAWDDRFGLGAGAEAAALAALVSAGVGSLAGPGAWLEVGG